MMSTPITVGEEPLLSTPALEDEPIPRKLKVKLLWTLLPPLWISVRTPHPSACAPPPSRGRYTAVTLSVCSLTATAPSASTCCEYEP